MFIYLFYFFFFWGGGGFGGAIVTGGMNMRTAIFCIHDTLSQPLLQNHIVS